MKNKIYAAYGGNMNIRQMGKRCPNAKVIGTGIIKGYQLTFRGHSQGIANIERIYGGEVPVILWEITQSCERALDIYEDVHSLYYKQKVQVTTELGETVTAMVHMMFAKFQDMPAEPNPHYLNTISQGYKDGNLRLEPLREAVKRVQEEMENQCSGTKRLYQAYKPR